MIIENNYVILPETAEEVLLANEAILKYREEKAKKELLQKHKMSISFAISDAIGEIGLEETKRIVRELNHELRTLKESV